MGNNLPEFSNKIEHIHESELNSVYKNVTAHEIVSILTHDLVQPLMVINTYVQGSFLRINNNSFDQTQFVKVLEKIHQHSEIINSKLQKVKNFIKPLKSKKPNTTVGIHKLILDAIRIAFSKIQSNEITIYFNFKNRIPKLKLNRMKLLKVIAMLISNSAEAFKERNLNKQKLKICIEALNKQTVKINIEHIAILSQSKSNGLFSHLLFDQNRITQCNAMIQEEGGIFTSELLKNGHKFQLILYDNKENDIE